MNLNDKCAQVLNRLAKWRSVFAGWQLGTRSKGDPESDAVRDHREVTILMRAELSALAGLLLEKRIFTQEELQERLIAEAEFLDKAYERTFPGFSSTDVGMALDLSKVKETMKDWRP